MSQTALAELSLRNDTESGRTGELTTPICWSDSRDVSMQQLTVGDLEFSVLDYGDRLAIPLKIRECWNEGRDVEKNQFSIIHLAACLGWHLQNRPNRPPHEG